jgi:acyl-homoserine-lactone acylase
MIIRSLRAPLSILGLLALLACGRPPAVTTAASRTASPGSVVGSAEILWDTWGVPHIFATDDRDLFYALGWAETESHGDLLLKMYGESRGRAAEYWGKDYLDSDRWVQTNDIPARARRWYERQTPELRANLGAFAAGVNAYARTHPDRLSGEFLQVVPIDAVDVLARIQHLVHFTFLANQGAVAQQIQSQMAAPSPPPAGSMGWVVAPGRTANGHALLLMNPHLGWDSPEIWFEAQLTAPGVNVYGATLVGMPVLAMGFNDRLGWALTVNLLDAYDLYDLTLRDGGYQFDGQVRRFEEEQRVLKVRGPDGKLEQETLKIQHSVHGPVVWTAGNRAVALRVAGIEEPDLGGEFWQMAKARDLGEFEAAVSRLELPMFTILYADQAGHILHLFNGRVPVRAKGDWDFWQGIVPGDTSATLWTRTHPYGELPRLLDPPSGWMQNTNDPPWGTTFPVALDAAKFPPYMSPIGMGFRQQESSKLLLENPHMSLDDMIRAKHTTHSELADRVLDDLLPAARQQGSDVLRQAADVLAAWDRQTEADSRGAVLFQAFFRELGRRRQPGQNSFAVPWSAAEPLSTPRGLADKAKAVTALEAAAQSVLKQYGRLDVSWGEVFRFRRGSLDLPANGGPSNLGIVRTVEFGPPQDGRAEAVGGETFIAAVEFSQPPRAKALLSYGNSSQPGSPHRTDQLPLLARKELRPVWRDRAEVEAHVEQREHLAAPDSRP